MLPKYIYYLLDFPIFSMEADGEPCLAESTHATDKPVSLAFYEIAEGEVTYKRTKEGIK